MENRNQKEKMKKEQEQSSPYQELYGKKEGEATIENGTEKALDKAGAFGSAASKPGPESGSKDKFNQLKQSEDGRDMDEELRDDD